jgi:hypothetical protein
MSTAGDVARQWHSLYCTKGRAELKLKLRTFERQQLDQNFRAEEMKQRIGRDNLGARVAMRKKRKESK